MISEMIIPMAMSSCSPTRYETPTNPSLLLPSHPTSQSPPGGIDKALESANTKPTAGALESSTGGEGPGNRRVMRTSLGVNARPLGPRRQGIFPILPMT